MITSGGIPARQAKAAGAQTSRQRVEGATVQSLLVQQVALVVDGHALRVDFTAISTTPEY